MEKDGGNRKGLILVLAEKPSVALSIGRALGAVEKRDGYLEGRWTSGGRPFGADRSGAETGYLVSWCVGHLVELAAADCYDERYSRWERGDLPIVPKPWKFVVSAGTGKQFEIVKGLMCREDVTGLVCATDAGREGELIFRLAYHQAGCGKPFERLWISSMEDEAIRAGFAALRPGADYDRLYQAALCRAKADWLVGINATRLFTTLYRVGTLNVGRVMTPTLALLVERENAINGFQKEKFYTVELSFGGFAAASGRFKSRTEAEKLRKGCVGKAATVGSVEKRQKAEKPPKLFDLTSLQREANRVYGYTAQQTIDYLQSLYEKKLATYPRTDSRYLTEDMAGKIPGLCEAVAGTFPFSGGTSGKDGLRVEASLVIDGGKVSDHHAILPTAGVAGADLGELPTGERKVLAMVAARLLCAVCPEDYVTAETAAVLVCGGQEFTAKGSVCVCDGWKGIERAFLAEYGGKKDGGADGERTAERLEGKLSEIVEGQTLMAEAAVLKEGATSAPKRYTEDSLLSAMENAGAEDFAEIEGVERKGLGTSATRAGTIEKLVKGGFAERKGRQLIPTKRGMELIGIVPDSVKSVKLTAEWEADLKRVERGELAPEEFMDGIEAMVQGLVKEYAGADSVREGAFAVAGREVIGKCPRCGKPVYEGKKSFYCSGYKDEPPCGFALWKENPYFKSKRKELTKTVAAALLKDGKVKMKGLFSEKKGILYDATIVMEDKGEQFVGFRLEFEKTERGGNKS